MYVVQLMSLCVDQQPKTTQLIYFILYRDHDSGSLTVFGFFIGDARKMHTLNQSHKQEKMIQLTSEREKRERMQNNVQ